MDSIVNKGRWESQMVQESRTKDRITYWTIIYDF